jgi:hypothetical protein
MHYLLGHLMHQLGASMHQLVQRVHPNTVKELKKELKERPAARWIWKVMTKRCWPACTVNCSPSRGLARAWGAKISGVCVTDGIMEVRTRSRLAAERLQQDVTALKWAAGRAYQGMSDVRIRTIGGPGK